MNGWNYTLGIVDMVVFIFRTCICHWARVTLKFFIIDFSHIFHFLLFLVEKTYEFLGCVYVSYENLIFVLFLLSNVNVLMNKISCDIRSIKWIILSKMTREQQCSQWKCRKKKNLSFFTITSLPLSCSYTDTCPQHIQSVHIVFFFLIENCAKNTFQKLISSDEKLKFSIFTLFKLNLRFYECPIVR